ncbi:unnamed protein product, partial [Rotaria sp. Silwood1]
SLIPSMTKYGWMKPDDELYVPDDKIVAQLFESERLPIIKLPGKVNLNYKIFQSINY